VRCVQLSSLARRARGVALNSAIVMGGYLLSRVTGLLRDIIISARFGTAADFGAYRAAFKITDLLYLVIIGGALGSTFIPVFVQLWEREDQERAWRLASAVTTWALLALGVAAALLFVLADPLARWLYGGASFSAQELALVAQLTRLFLLSPLLLGLGGLAMAVLNARERFALPALAPALYNLGIIGGALWLAPNLGVWGLAWGVVAGAALYLLLQIPGLLRIGLRLRPTLGRDLAELRVIALQFAPRLVGQSAAQASILVTAALTARLALGDERLGGLDYAYQLMLLPFGIFSLSLSTVAFPRLARLHAEGRLDTLAADVRRTLALILLLSVPSAVALSLLPVPLVRLLLQRGAFDQESLRYTVLPLIGYASVLPGFAASEIMIRAFFAMQRTRPPVLIGLLQVGLNLLLGGLVLLAGGGTGMLALAFSIANNLEALLLALALHRRLPGIWREPAFRRSLLAITGAALALALALLALTQLALPWLPFLALEGEYNWQRDLPALLGWLALAAAIGAPLYAAAAAALGAQEVRAALGRLRRINAK
jgi:putative peptidoglycan lipid II flippase